MRLAFFILLFVNFVLFAWGKGYLGEQDAGREPERLQRQVEPEKLRIVSVAATPAVAPAPAAAETKVACKRIEWLSNTEIATIKNSVAALPGWDISQMPRQEAPVLWVVVPELPSRAMAEKKNAELRQLGIMEGEVVEHTTPGLGAFAVSLGVFRGQSLAEEFLQSLVRKGVRSARLVKRDLPAEKFALEIRAPADEINRKLPDWMTPLVGVNLADCSKQ